MSIWSLLFGGSVAPAPMDINPATGLPMAGDISGIDVGGNPYGVDLYQSGDYGAPDFGGGADMWTGSGTDWPY
ncbi:hypothetical protein MCEMSEM22_00784 [Comamonadaceae bacterium]